jgi:hypothetical protein
MSEYVCGLLGSGGVFFGVRLVAVINKIKYNIFYTDPTSRQRGRP